MKLAYSTNAFTRTDLASALNHIADLGFSGAEILCDNPHWFPGKVSDEDIDNIIKILHERNIQVSNLNVNTANGYYHPRPPENVFEPALSNTNIELRQWRQNYTIEAIRLAKKIGGHCVSVTSGHPSPGCTPERSLDIFVDSLKYICDAAEKHDIKVGIEYEPGLLVERGSEVNEVIERVNSSKLGVNFDIGHSYLDGENPEDVIALLSGRIWNVHVEDIKNRKHFHLVPGEGDLPFDRYFDALKAINYKNFLTVELYTYPEQALEVGRRSYHFLTTHFGLT